MMGGGGGGEETVAGLLARFAAGTPTPGAGSAAALLGALAGSLVQAVAKHTLRRAGPFAARAEALRGAAEARVARLHAAIEEDAAAFERFAREWRRSKGERGSGAPRPELDGAASAALGVATDLPLEIAEHCAALAALARELEEHGHRPARAEAITARLAARAGAEAALRTAELNLELAGRAAWVEPCRETIRRLRGGLG